MDPPFTQHNTDGMYRRISSETSDIASMSQSSKLPFWSHITASSGTFGGLDTRSMSWQLSQ